MIEWPSNGINYHRLLVPYQNLVADYGYNVKVFQTSLHALQGFKFNRGDLFVFARMFPSDYRDPKEAVRFAEYLKSKGVKIVMDIDDYWHLYEGHTIDNSWKKEQKEFTELSIKLADVITVTNERLKSKVRKLNKNVHVLPNAINDQDSQWIIPERNWQGVRFGYFGGNTHNQDLAVMKTDMSDFESYYAVDEHQMFGFKHNLGIKKINEYAKLYDNVDVALAPLVANKFNHRKSNLKIIEAAFKKCCVVASDVVTFSDDKRYKDAVIYVKEKHIWKDVLQYLERNKQEVKERGEMLYNLVKNDYSIKSVNLQRNKILERL